MFKHLAVAAIAAYLGYEYAMQKAAGAQTAEAVGNVVTGIKANLDEFLSGLPQLDDKIRGEISDMIVKVKVTEG